MADDTKPAAADAKPKAKGDVILTNPDDPKSDPVIDFADYATAKAQADALGGEVEPIGTAFHVNVDG
jgi:hypothetical protein